MSFIFVLVGVSLQFAGSHTSAEAVGNKFREDYTFLGETQSFYKIHKIFKTWDEAKNTCTSEGSTFFFPENICESDVVLKLLNVTEAYNWVYIGVSIPTAPGVFETIDERLIKDVYNVWGPGEPNNAGGMEACVILRKDGTLNDDKCDQQYPFICKKAIDVPAENALCIKKGSKDTNGESSTHFFRKDYTYLADTESFYKIHTISGTWKEAKRRCAVEGATFFYPEDQKEVDVVLNFLNQTQPFYWVFIGISSLIVKGVFETVDGIPATDVYSKWSPGEPNNANNEEDCVILRRDGTLNDDNCARKYPFICKKSLNSLDWNLLCDIPDMSYSYNEGQGKCYKFHLNPMSWTDAYAVCSAEQSYLAVINSQTDAEHLVQITRNASKDKVQGNFLAGAVYLGFHNRDGEGWKSVKGQTLQDSGYEVWAQGQPDGGEKELCGSMFYNGQLHDLACNNQCFFICEHDIKKLSNSFDERFDH